MFMNALPYHRVTHAQLHTLYPANECLKSEQFVYYCSRLEQRKSCIDSAILKLGEYERVVEVVLPGSIERAATYSILYSHRYASLPITPETPCTAQHPPSGSGMPPSVAMGAFAESLRLLLR